MKEIVLEYRKKNKSGININYLSEDIDFNELKDKNRQIGMFEEKRLLIGKNVLQNKKIRKKFKERSEEIVSGDNVLILKEEERLREEFIQELKRKETKNILIQKFDKLEGKKLKKWYQKEFAKYNVDPEEGVIDKFSEYVGNDLWRASNEISKLCHMKIEEKVTRKEIEKYVRPELETDIFDTIDSLGKGEKGKALEFIEEHIEKGDSPFYILSMINYQVRNLLTASQLMNENLNYKEAQRESKMSPFVFKKSFKQAKNLNFHRIKKIHRKICEVDLDSKLGKISPETGLVLIIAEF